MLELPTRNFLSAVSSVQPIRNLPAVRMFAIAGRVRCAFVLTTIGVPTGMPLPLSICAWIWPGTVPLLAFQTTQ